MIFLFPFLLVPLVLVGLLEPYWQRRVLSAIIVLTLALVIVIIIRAVPPRTSDKMKQDHCWRKGLDASTFQMRFINHAAAAKCQIAWSKIADLDRVGFAIHRGKGIAILLCLSPAATLRDADLRMLDEWLHSQGASVGLIVAGASSSLSAAATEQHPAIQLASYDQLGENGFLKRLVGKGAT